VVDDRHCIDAAILKPLPVKDPDSLRNVEFSNGMMSRFLFENNTAPLGKTTQRPVRSRFFWLRRFDLLPERCRPAMVFLVIHALRI
jgi:hypothetical protein